MTTNITNSETKSKAISIIPYPTASGMERALALNAGMSIAVKYIAVGKGKQKIILDEGGRAITEKLKDHVGFIEVLFAKKVNKYQWQLTVNMAGIVDYEWNFSEFLLCDADKKAIAIYGHETQALYSVTPVLDSALLGVNLVLGTFPADSIKIEHHNLPLNLFFDKEFKQINDAIAANTNDIIRHDDSIKLLTNNQETYRKDSLRLFDKLAGEITIGHVFQIQNSGA